MFKSVLALAAATLLPLSPQDEPWKLDPASSKARLARNLLYSAGLGVSPFCGLSAFGIVIDRCEECPLSKEGIKSQVELKLRLAGIQAGGGANIFLYVNIATLANKNVAGAVLGYSTRVDLSCNGSAILLENGASRVGVSFWNEGTLICGRDDHGRQIKEALDEALDAFLLEWVKANPVKREEKTEERPKDPFTGLPLAPKGQSEALEKPAPPLSDVIRRWMAKQPAASQPAR